MIQLFVFIRLFCDLEDLYFCHYKFIVVICACVTCENWVSLSCCVAVCVWEIWAWMFVIRWKAYTDIAPKVWTIEIVVINSIMLIFIFESKLCWWNIVHVCECENEWPWRLFVAFISWIWPWYEEYPPNICPLLFLMSVSVGPWLSHFLWNAFAFIPSLDPL